WTPLHLAAELGDRAAVEKLLGKNPNLNAQASPGAFTPLHHAIKGEHKAIVELLLAKGADANIHGALMTAVQTGNVEIAGLLLDKDWDKLRKQPGIGVPVKTGPNDGFVVGGTPLTAAVIGQQPAVAELFLAKGANVNAKHPSGASLLHLATALGDVDMMKLLV